LAASHFRGKSTVNNVSVTFFKNFLVTTTGSVSFVAFPNGRGSLDRIRAAKSSKNMMKARYFRPIVSTEMTAAGFKRNNFVGKAKK
jgi:hypothetical protein